VIVATVEDDAVIVGEAVAEFELEVVADDEAVADFEAVAVGVTVGVGDGFVHPVRVGLLFVPAGQSVHVD